MIKTYAQKRTQTGPLASRIKLLAFTGVAIATLGACASGPYIDAPATARHKITVAESVERLEIYPNQNGLVMSARDRQAMQGFLASYRQGGDGPIYMNRPSGQTGQGVSQAASQVRQSLASVGLGGLSVQEGSYESAPGAPAPVVISYRRLKTLVPDCRQGSDLALTFGNSPAPEWGCSYHANIAAMVADPNQFLDPYRSEPPNSARRMEVYEKYIAGEVTGSQRNPDQKVSSQAASDGGGGE